jgi:hypothetical protein
MYKAAERAFSGMLALKSAGEFGLAMVLCPQEAGHLASSVSVILTSSVILMEKTL